MSEKSNSNGCGIIGVIIIALVIIGYVGVFTGNYELMMILPVLLFIGLFSIGYIIFIHRQNINASEEEKKIMQGYLDF